MSSLIAAITIVLLTVTTTFSALQIRPTKVYGDFNTTAITNSVIMSPITLTLGTLPEVDTYWVNVTSNGGASDYINNVDVELPSGWTYNGGAAAYGPPTVTFIVSGTGSGWVNFTTGSVAFYGGLMVNFSIPVAFSVFAPTLGYSIVGTWNVYCYQGVTPSTANPLSFPVTVNLQFHSTMVPNYVKNGTSYIYTITVFNDACPTGIIEILITFPAGQWSFNALLQSTPPTWTVVYNGVDTFILTGPNLYIPPYTPSSASITVNMTVPANAPTNEYYWTVTAINAGLNSLGTYSMKAVVDASRPIVGFIAPAVSYYSAGSGNYMWINASVVDTPSIEKYGITVTINDSRFQSYSTPFTETNPTTYVYYFTNITAIPDGLLAVQVTATDPAGNIGTGTVVTTVDNSAPRLIWIDVVDQGGNSLHLGGGIYWMKASTTTVSVAAAFYNLQPVTGSIYFNSTAYVWSGNSTDNYYYYSYTFYPDRVTSHGYPVTGANFLTVNITLTDASSPTPNVFTQAWTVERDTIPPSAVTFGATKMICGGIIIPSLTATDNVGIDHYAFYLNGSSHWLYPDDLNSSSLDWDGPFSGYMFATVNNITVLELYEMYNAGDVANITIAAVDYGSNMGPVSTLLVTVPAGVWYPIEMYPKWNLISLPLLPNSTATSDIYSLMLLNGAAGVKAAYSFDNTAKTWTLNPASMTDGNAYWINMKAYDVLIVQGYHISMPPGSPPAITQYTYKQGWNLAGFTEDTWDIWDSGYYAYYYVASLQSTMVLQSYFRFAYSWNPYSQQWFTVDLTGSVWPYVFYPGQGFYMYLYNDQTLIPPIVPP